jgi:hypothetical protein
MGVWGRQGAAIYVDSMVSWLRSVPTNEEEALWVPLGCVCVCVCERERVRVRERERAQKRDL